MKILTAASAVSDSDYCHAIVGEIVVSHLIICTNPGSRAECGCDREHLGILTHKPTTVVEVSETELTFDALVDTCQQDLIKGDWDKAYGPEGIQEAAEDLVTLSAQVAADHPIGALLRPRYDSDREQWFYDEVNE